MESISSIVASSAGAADKAKAGLGADFETFLTLLTTQLQVQDPLDPMDSGEFTNQLIQFTNVEQAIQSNENLENIATLTAIIGLNDSVSFIGKDAMVEQSVANLSNGEAKWVYALAGKTDLTTLTVKDELGKTVYEIEGNHALGPHDFNWDGKDANGTLLDDGNYSLTVTSTDTAGVAVPSQVFMLDKVTAVDFAYGDSFLNIGGFNISMGSVVSVREPTSPAL